MQSTYWPLRARFLAVRICQEALTNVAGHADAAHVVISLRRKDQQLILAIIDDGYGVDLQQLNNRGRTLGILGMKERALMMGGNLAIQTQPGPKSLSRLFTGFSTAANISPARLLST